MGQRMAKEGVPGGLANWVDGTTWLVQRLPGLLAIFVPVTCCLFLVQGRYTLGFDVQDSRCIPEGVVFLLDRADRDLQRGGLVGMISEGNMPFFRDGAVMIKRLVALPGDVVEIDRERTLVNGVEVGTGLAHYKRTRKPIEALERRFVVQPGYVFLMGDTFDSWDGRYYGPVEMSRLAGGARVVF